MRIVSDLERMGDLAVHVAKVARMRFPEHAVPQELRPIVPRGRARRRDAGGQGRHGHRHAATSRPRRRARDRRRRDGRAAPQPVQRSCCRDDWPHGIEAAIDITLLGRYYERFADHAVSVARRVVYLVTGERADARDAGRGLDV